MRRTFVIFLILLFPLNVFALSMSVSTMQAGAPHAAVVADALDMHTMGDVDSDEPPAGYDFHDSVNEDGLLQPAVLPCRRTPAPASPQRGRAPFPPIKPPPEA